MTHDPKKVKNRLAGGRKFGLTCDSPKVLGAQRRVRLQVLSPPRHRFSAGPFCPEGGQASSKSCLEA